MKKIEDYFNELITLDRLINDAPEQVFTTTMHDINWINDVKECLKNYKDMILNIEVEEVRK